MITTVFLQLAIGHHETSGLDLTIEHHNGVVYQSTNMLVDTLCIEFAVCLPCTIKFKIGGRLSNDTVLDDQGNICKDKYIELKNINLDGFSIDAWKIPNSHLFLQTEDTIHRTSFWSANGTAHLIIDQEDPLVWVLDHKKIIGIPE
jgi:hypothetical protein